MSSLFQFIDLIFYLSIGSGMVALSPLLPRHLEMCLDHQERLLLGIGALGARDAECPAILRTDLHNKELFLP